MVACYLRGLREGRKAALALRAEKARGYERLTGGMRYVDLPRMAYYVEKTAFRNAVTSKIRILKGEAA
jgi:hypothetical protein